MDLVTGGAGFIGSHLTWGLLSRGRNVRVLDDLSAGPLDPDLAANVDFIEADVSNKDAAKQAVRNVETVFHLAAQVSVPGSALDPQGCYESNVNGTLCVLEAARQAGVKRVVLASSAAVYGASADPVKENGPKQPFSPYAASKLAMEEAALMFGDLYALPVVCLRYFNAYGPRQKPDSAYAAVIPAFISAVLAGDSPIIYSDGEQRRDFVHVDDVVRANLLAAEKDDANGQILNISVGGAVTINELASILQELIPNAPEPVYEAPRDGDIYVSEAVIDRAWEALGYRPEVALVEGLRSTVEWFRQERLQSSP